MAAYDLDPFTGGSDPGDGEFLRDPFGRATGKKAATFVGRHGLIVVSTEINIASHLLRDQRGWYVSTQGQVAEEGQRLALELATHVREAFLSSRKRPKVSTGRLVAAIMHRKNRVGRKEGYGVGNPEFLDRSEARYWRQIDQGFTGHVGRLITGVWGETLTGDWRAARTGPYPVAGAPITGFGANAQGRLIPMGRKQAYKVLRRQVGSRNKETLKAARLYTAGIIENPIAAQEYFRRGWETFDARERTTAAVAQVLRDNLPPPR